MSEKYLIVGLGNPGRKYKKNRHNVGFQVIEHLAKRHGLKFTRSQSNALVTTGRIGGKSVILAKPKSYMNNSGRSVNALRRFYQIDWDHMLIIFDDLDLPVGTLRMKPSGGAGGQNGMRSVISQSGGNRQIPRLRIGIGRPPGKMDPAAYVLQDFNKEQREIIEEIYDRAADAIESWLQDGIELAMSRHNGPAEM